MHVGSNCGSLFSVICFFCISMFVCVESLLNTNISRNTLQSCLNTHSALVYSIALGFCLFVTAKPLAVHSELLKFINWSHTQKVLKVWYIHLLSLSWSWI